jgi:hypothetical protein
MRVYAPVRSFESCVLARVKSAQCTWSCFPTSPTGSTLTNHLVHFFCYLALIQYSLYDVEVQKSRRLYPRAHAKTRLWVWACFERYGATLSVPEFLMICTFSEIDPLQQSSQHAKGKFKKVAVVDLVDAGKPREGAPGHYGRTTSRRERRSRNLKAGPASPVETAAFVFKHPATCGSSQQP